MPTLRFRSAGATHPGLAREVNEDHFRIEGDHGLWIVADGMGGHASGQVASQIATEQLVDFMVRWRKEDDFVWPFDIDPNHPYGESCVLTAVRVANVRVYNHALVNPTCAGMGTTVVLMHYDEQQGLVIAHVGDSRCYRLRNDSLDRLTVDHSLAQQLASTAQMSEVQAQSYVGSNVILRAVGVDDEVEADRCVSDPQNDDIYLLCSDGLTDMVSDDDIRSYLITHRENPSASVSALIAAANRAGGHDNVTAIVIRVEVDDVDLQPG